MKNLNKLYFFIFIILFGCAKENSLELDFSNQLNKSDFKIEMEILGDSPRKTIFTNGKEYEIPNGYGENEWYFNYKDSLYSYFRHFKSNRNDKHFYRYNFYEKDNQVFVSINIDGVSGENKVLKFTQSKK